MEKKVFLFCDMCEFFFFQGLIVNEFDYQWYFKEVKGIIYVLKVFIVFGCVVFYFRKKEFFFYTGNRIISERRKVGIQVVFIMQLIVLNFF